jgi:hypothetical protein
VTGAAVLDGLTLLLVGGVRTVSGTLGEVVSGSSRGMVVPELVERGVVTTTGARVVTVDPPAGAVAGAVVVVDSTLVEVDDEEVDVVGREEVVVGRTVVTGDTVATWVWFEPSVPVTTSNSRATSAIDARA